MPRCDEKIQPLLIWKALADYQNGVMDAMIACGQNEVLNKVERARFESRKIDGPDLTLKSWNEAHVNRVLSQSTSLNEAAKTLGVNQSTLWRWRQKSAGNIIPLQQVG